MNQNLFKAVKTGCGVALLAATLGNSALADLHSFAYSGIWYKGGTTPTYLVNVPSGHRSSDATIVLEVALASAASNTYSLGYSFGALGATAGETGGFSISNNVVSATVSTVNAFGSSQTYDLASSSASSSNAQLALFGLWGANSYTYYLPGSGPYTMSLQQQLTLGSGASQALCYVTYSGKMDTDGNYKIPTATNSFSATITDGTGLSATAVLADTNGALAAPSVWFLNAATNTTYVAANWTSFSSTVLPIYDVLRSGTIGLASSIFLKAYASSSSAVSSANTGGLMTNWPTSAAVFINRLNSCNGVYANRTAVNNSGLILGGNNGLARIW